MLVWQTEKRWTYHGRTCEIQRTAVGDSTQYRGLVEVETGVSDRALASSPVGELRRKSRPKRRAAGEYREWVYFARSEIDAGRLREETNALADHVGDVEV